MYGHAVLALDGRDLSWVLSWNENIAINNFCVFLNPKNAFTSSCYVCVWYVVSIVNNNCSWIFLNSLLAIRITLDSISQFAVILYDVKRRIQW
jgi:hypothetical protein